MRYTYTCTYTILNVSESTFDDIKRRLDEAGTLEKHLVQSAHNGELIILGATALRKEILHGTEKVI